MNTEPEGEAFSLICGACGRCSEPDANGWRAQYVIDGEAVFFCPECSEREYGRPARNGLLLHADVLVDKVVVGSAGFDTGADELWSELESFSGNPNRAMPRGCAHTESERAYVYVRDRDEHWPIEFCSRCWTITAGRRLLPEPASKPRWEYDEDDVIADRWRRDWPKAGLPRGKRPPAATAWPATPDP